MIYLITGVPGSGKTLYAVSTLLQKLMAEMLKAKDGTPIERRLVVDGIPDLALPHELMCERPDEVSINVAGVRGPVIMPVDGAEHSEHGLWNWFQWCKPGDIIVADEVQRHWRPRGMGVKPPMEIAALETHRHLGVDFILITQNPMLLDQNVRRLVGRHQHVRRILGMARAVIYEWDGCSADVHRTATATTSMWRFPKSAYSLYKSAELHTKQRFKLPLWLVVPVLSIVGGIFLAPRLWATTSAVVSGKGVPSNLVVPVAVAASAPRPGASAAVAAALAPASAAQLSSGGYRAGIVDRAPPALAGCVIFGGATKCYDQDGFAFEASEKERDRLLGSLVSKRKFSNPEFVASDDDAELVAVVHHVPVQPPARSWAGPHWIK